MQELYELKEMLCKELKELGKQKQMNASTLEYVDKLAHAAKNLDRVIEKMEEESGHSERSYRSYRSYGSYGSYNGSMRGSMDGGSYDDGAYDGSYRRGRDSMGRFVSRDEGMDLMTELRNLANGTSDAQLKDDVTRLIRRMER